STDYEYLTILKDAPIFTKVTIDYRYLAIIKDVTKEEIDEYLEILKDAPVSDKSDKINQINILKSLKD
ncbi:10461_t:CDS:1, partial [Gigaspora margarita]